MTNSLSGQVAANVRAELARRQWAQLQLAEKLGISTSALSRRMKNLSLWDLEHIAAALNVDPAALLITPPGSVPTQLND